MDQEENTDKFTISEEIFVILITIQAYYVPLTYNLVTVVLFPQCINQP